MKKIIYIIILIISLCLIHSCKSIQYVPVEKVKIDSVSIKDTIFEVKLIPYKDSVSTKDSTSFLSNKYAYSWARYSNGVLQHSLGIWPFAVTTIKVPYFMERYIYIENPTVVEVEKELSRWQKLKIELGGYAIVFIISLIVFIIGLIVYKYIKIN